MHRYPGEKILICAPSNTAIDFVAERLNLIPYLENKFVRVYPENQEYMYNLDETNIKPYSLLYHVIKESPFYKVRTEEEKQQGKKPYKFFRNRTKDDIRLFSGFRTNKEP